MRLRSLSLTPLGLAAAQASRHFWEHRARCSWLCHGWLTGLALARAASCHFREDWAVGNNNGWLKRSSTQELGRREKQVAADGCAKKAMRGIRKAARLEGSVEDAA